MQEVTQNAKGMVTLAKILKIAKEDKAKYDKE